jgi:hypothetical protein
VLDAEGLPTLVVDLQVANQGTEALSQLTVLVKVRGSDGVLKSEQRATLDLEGVRPGIGERRTALVPGVGLDENDEVLVEIEAPLSTEELRRLPEFENVGGTS